MKDDRADRFIASAGTLTFDYPTIGQMADLLVAAHSTQSLPAGASSAAKPAPRPMQSGTQDIRHVVTAALRQLLGIDSVEGSMPLMAAGAHHTSMLLCTSSAGQQ